MVVEVVLKFAEVGVEQTVEIFLELGEVLHMREQLQQLFQGKFDEIVEICLLFHRQAIFNSGDVDVTLLDETFLDEKQLLNKIQSFDTPECQLQIVVPVDQTAPHYCVHIIDSFHLLVSVFDQQIGQVEHIFSFVGFVVALEKFIDEGVERYIDHPFGDEVLEDVGKLYSLAYAHQIIQNAIEVLVCFWVEQLN